MNTILIEGKRDVISQEKNEIKRLYDVKIENERLVLNQRMTRVVRRNNFKFSESDIKELYGRVFTGFGSFCEEEGCKKAINCVNYYIGLVNNSVYKAGDASLLQALCYSHGKDRLVNKCRSLNNERVKRWFNHNGFVSFATCGVCGVDQCKVTPWTAHGCHNMARSEGGSDDTDNIVPGHQDCNNSQGTLSIKQYRDSIGSFIQGERTSKVPAWFLDRAVKIVKSNKKKPVCDYVVLLNRLITYGPPMRQKDISEYISN